VLNAADRITLTVMKELASACREMSLRDVLATISQQPLAKNLGVEDEHDEESLDQE